jgi:Asp/Glu/hydantoin racemase
LTFLLKWSYLLSVLHKLHHLRNIIEANVHSKTFTHRYVSIFAIMLEMLQ